MTEATEKRINDYLDELDQQKQEWLDKQEQYEVERVERSKTYQWEKQVREARNSGYFWGITFGILGGFALALYLNTEPGKDKNGIV